MCVCVCAYVCNISPDSMYLCMVEPKLRVTLMRWMLCVCVCMVTLPVSQVCPAVVFTGQCVSTIW